MWRHWWASWWVKDTVLVAGVTHRWMRPVPSKRGEVPQVMGMSQVVPHLGDSQVGRGFQRGPPDGFLEGGALVALKISWF